MLKKIFIPLLFLTSMAFSLIPQASYAAANLLIGPTHISISPTSPVATIILLNRGNEEVTLQISAKSWDSNEQGKFVETDTADFAFFPRLIKLSAGQQKEIQVGYQGNFPKLEKPYRVYIAELPPIKQVGENKKQLAIVSTLNLSVPLFVKPDDEEHPNLPQFVIPRFSPKATEVKVQNLGVTNFLVRGIELTWQDAAQKTIATLSSKDAKRVLAQRFSQFLLPQVKADCTKATKLLAKLEIENQKTPYEQSFDWSGTCQL